MVMNQARKVKYCLVNECVHRIMSSVAEMEILWHALIIYPYC